MWAAMRDSGGLFLCLEVLKELGCFNVGTLLLMRGGRSGGQCDVPG